MLTAQRSLWHIEERDQQRVLALGQRDQRAVDVGAAPSAPVELPNAKSTAILLGLPLRGDTTGLSPAKHGADPREQFAKTERFGQIVIGAEFQANYAA